MKINKFTEISYYLNDIKGYVESACVYLNNPNDKVYDKQEILAYLTTVPEIVNDIKAMLIDIEIEVNINEQL